MIKNTDEMIERESKSFGAFLTYLVCMAISFVIIFEIFWKLHTILFDALNNFHFIFLFYPLAYCLELCLFIVLFCATSLFMILGIEWLQEITKSDAEERI